MRLWAQAGLGLRGGRTLPASGLAQELPLRQPRPPPWPPPLRGAQGRRGKHDSGYECIGAGGHRLSEGAPREGRGSVKKTLKICWEGGDRRGRPWQSTIVRVTAAEGRVPLLDEDTKKVQRKTHKSGPRGWLGPPEWRQAPLESPGELRRGNEGWAIGGHSRAKSGGCLEETTLVAGTGDRRPPPWPPPSGGDEAVRGRYARQWSLRRGEGRRFAKGECVENFTVTKGERSAHGPHLARPGQVPTGGPDLTPAVPPPRSGVGQAPG